jgi:cytochrome c5
MKNLLSTFAIVIFIISGCTNYNAEELYPDNFCDTTNMKFSTNINTIINTNCIGCHSGIQANGNPQVRLDSYDGVKTVIDNGRLYNAITGVTKQMPPTGKLIDCPINQIKAWIDIGSPNN